MPVFKYRMLSGETGSLYASNIFEAEEEVWAVHEDHPESLKEAVNG